MTYQTIKVLINKAPTKYEKGYIEGDILVEATKFFVDNGLSDQEILEATFTALNAPEPNGIGNLTPAKIRVYHKVFPSLSVGDVVEIDGRRYACESLGWSEPIITRGVGPCDLCHQRRILVSYGPNANICADCLQGDPAEDLGLT